MYSDTQILHLKQCLKDIIKISFKSQSILLRMQNCIFYKPTTRIGLLSLTTDTYLEIRMFIYISSLCWSQKLKNSVAMEAFTPQTIQQFSTMCLSYILACYVLDVALIESITAKTAL